MKDLSPETVTRICRHPDVYPHIRDDGSPSPKDYYAPLGMQYLGDEGFFVAFQPISYSVWEAHIGAVPERRGNCHEVLAEAFQEMSKRGAKKILAHPLSSNDRAISCFLKAGMDIEGSREASLLRDGILHDQTCLGISL